MSTLIAIPIHNEQKYVRQVLAKIRSFHDQIVVIDDGSTDGTGAILDELEKAGWVRVIRHPVNQGYGQSLIDAFAFADREGYDWVITMDCDEQHEPERIPDFLHHIALDDADIISGSRYLAPRNDDDLPPGDRRSINATITAMLNDLFELHITDAFCGFKAHRVAALRKLHLTEKGYAFPMQFWPQVVRRGLKTKEIAVKLIYNDPNRRFGGNLDDPKQRLDHYMKVFNRELKKSSLLPIASESCSCSCGG